MAFYMYGRATTAVISLDIQNVPRRCKHLLHVNHVGKCHIFAIHSVLNIPISYYPRVWNSSYTHTMYNIHIITFL